MLFDHSLGNPTVVVELCFLKRNIHIPKMKLSGRKS